MFRVDQVDAQAWKFAVELLSHPNLIRLEWQRQQDENIKTTVDTQEEIASLDGLLTQAQKRLGIVLDKLLDAEMRDDTIEIVQWSTKRDEIKETIAQHQAELVNLHRKVTCTSLPEETIRTLAEFGAENRELLERDDLPYDVKRGLIGDLDLRGVTGIENGRKFVDFTFARLQRRKWLGDKSATS